jgi:hypothetical protein
MLGRSCRVIHTRVDVLEDGNLFVHSRRRMYHQIRILKYIKARNTIFEIDFRIWEELAGASFNVYVHECIGRSTDFSSRLYVQM